MSVDTGTVREMCVVYGIQWRRCALGGMLFEDGGRHIDGAPKSTWVRDPIADALREQSEFARQHWQEVFTGEGLEIWRASLALPDHRRYLLDVHFGIPKTFALKKQKVACLMSMFPQHVSSRTAYYEQLDRLLESLLARLDPVVPHETKRPDEIARTFLTA